MNGEKNDDDVDDDDDDDVDDDDDDNPLTLIFCTEKAQHFL